MSKKNSVGLSITPYTVEAAVFAFKQLVVLQTVSQPVLNGTFSPAGDQVLDAEALKESISFVISQLKTRPDRVHVSIPAAYMRKLPAYAMPDEQLYAVLAAEVLQAKPFEQTTPILDYAHIPMPVVQVSEQSVLVGAVRRDTLETYLNIFQELKMKVASVSLQPLSVLRGMAGSGILDALVLQAGPDAVWGSLWLEENRLRLALWQANRLLEWKELYVDTQALSAAGQQELPVARLIETVRAFCGTQRPVVWFTDQVPHTLTQILSYRLGVPVRSALLGDGLKVPSTNAQIATVGSSMLPHVEFPFAMNLLKGLKAAGGSSRAVESEGEQPALLSMGITFAALSILMSLIAYILATYKSQQAEQYLQVKQLLNSELQILQGQLASLEQRRFMSVQMSRDIDQGYRKNDLLITLLDDLSKKVPENTWVYSLKAADDLEVKGMSVYKEDPESLRQALTKAPYVQSLVLRNVSATQSHGNTVYNFTLQGGLNWAGDTSSREAKP